MENKARTKININYRIHSYSSKITGQISDWQITTLISPPPALSPYRMDSITCNIKPCCPDGAVRTESSAGNYDFSSFFFFLNFLNCDWMATAAFSVSGASMSMSMSSGMSFLDASGHREISYYTRPTLSQWQCQFLNIFTHYDADEKEITVLVGNCFGDTYVTQEGQDKFHTSNGKKNINTPYSTLAVLH